MSEEEIKEEAGEHCNEVMCSVCENKTCDNTKLATLKCREWRDRCVGYYCGAEPREKRIKELEKENEKLDKQIDTMLEDCKRCVYRKTSDQLTQAKKYIRQLLDFIKAKENGDGRHPTPYFYEEYEQFLKEIEK